MPNTQPPIDASQPTIQGFDMPSAAGDAAVDQVMIAMLDMVPDRRWMGAFVEQSAAFRDAHALYAVVGPDGVWQIRLRGDAVVQPFMCGE